jgi:hypothetical protein
MSRIGDLVVYILIGLTVVGLLIWTANYNTAPDSLVKWGGLTGNTALLFWWVVKQYREHKRLFWWTIAVLFLVHTVSFYVILRKVEHWRMAWYLLICTAELVPMTIVVDRTMAKFGNRHHRRAKGEGSV